jgi:MFS family permease
VEHPCHRCGSPVDDASPFCGECGAPQVRFSRPETPVDDIVISTESQPVPAATPPLTDPHLETNRRVSDRERSVAMRSALKGAAIAAVFCLFPAGFAIAMPLAGFLAVLFYRKRSWRAESSRRSGFKLGALAGLFAFMIFGLFVAVEASIPASRDEFRKLMIDQLHTLQSRYSDPEQRADIEYFASPKGFPLFIALATASLCAFFVFFAGIGGAVAAALLRRRGPPG